MYKSYNANFVDMTSNRCEGLAWSQGVSQRIVCTTWSHTGQSTTHGMVTEASQRFCSNFQTLCRAGGVAGICVFIFRFTMPWPLRPLAAIYPCCMLACLCSVIVFTPHLLLLLLPPTSATPPRLWWEGLYLSCLRSTLGGRQWNLIDVATVLFGFSLHKGGNYMQNCSW